MDHNANLETFLNSVKNGVLLNRNKIQLPQLEVPFIGHVAKISKKVLTKFRPSWR